MQIYTNIYSFNILFVSILDVTAYTNIISFCAVVPYSEYIFMKNNQFRKHHSIRAFKFTMSADNPQTFDHLRDIITPHMSSVTHLHTHIQHEI